MAKIYHSVDWIKVVNTDALKDAKIEKEDFIDEYEVVIFYKDGESFFEFHTKESISKDFVSEFMDSTSGVYDIQRLDDNSFGIYVSFPYMETSSTQDIAITIARDIIDFIKGYNEI